MHCHERLLVYNLAWKLMIAKIQSHHFSANVPESHPPWKKQFKTGRVDDGLVEIGRALNGNVVVVGVWCGRGAIQCNSVRTPACWKHGRVVLHRQRGSVWHLLPYTQADHSNLWRSQPPCLSSHLRHHYLSALPRPGMTASLQLADIPPPARLSWNQTLTRRLIDCWTP